MRFLPFAAIVGLTALSDPSRASDAVYMRLTYDRALALTRERAPTLAVARGREAVARADARVAGIYPNPLIVAGTSTQAAKMSFGATIPLVVFGQRGAAIEAGEAELGMVMIDTLVTSSEVRWASARAYVALWLGERTAEARADAAHVAKRLEDAVRGRVEVGTAPELEALRAHAEHLRAEADADATAQLVNAAAADLARWIGNPAARLRTDGEASTPATAPPFSGLADKMQESPGVQREEADARAAQARAKRERALVRSTLFVDVGVDAYDPSLNGTNYRAQVGVEVPLFNQRGPLIDRELQAAAAASLRSHAEMVARLSDLRIAYETFIATTSRTKALEEGVLPAAEAAAKATDESYLLGRATLLTVLDAERALIDAKLSLLEAKAARANAWIDAERAMGQP